MLAAAALVLGWERVALAWASQACAVLLGDGEAASAISRSNDRTIEVGSLRRFICGITLRGWDGIISFRHAFPDSGLTFDADEIMTTLYAAA